MKKLLLSLLLATTTIGMMAVPAKRGVWKTIQLSDGTEARVTLVGDEFGHYWKAEDGQTYKQVPGTEIYAAVNEQTVTEKARVRRAKVNAKRLVKREFGKPTHYEGSKKALIILVNFSDVKFKTANNNALFQRIANEVNFSEGNFRGSMADYFKAQSRGKFLLSFDVVGPVTVSKKASYYGENSDDENEEDLHPGEMICEAVQLAKSQVSNWKQYDWDNDGNVDQVYIVYAGKGEADGGDENTIWPHAFDLYTAHYYGDGDGPVQVATNLYVNSYACGGELNGQTGSIAGIGTMCHEFSHCLGYPDFYDTGYSGGQGMCDWDLMDSGSYNGDGYQPAGYTSYERWFAGWETPITLEAEDVSVTNMKSLQSGGESYIIYNKKNREEYFLLENRQSDGWDESLYGAGLLILHVDHDESAWTNNTPNSEANHQRMTWIPADKKYHYETYQGSKYYYTNQTDVFPYGNVKTFNKDFGTLAKFYNKNTDGTYYLDSSVEDITQNADGTISFNFVANYTGGSGGGSVAPTGDYLFYESFSQCNGTGGNDGSWSGLVANSDFVPDNDGWAACSDSRGAKAFGADECAKFGTGKIDGWATTPAFTVNGTGNLTFQAGAWNATADQTTLNLSVSNGSISPSSVTMTKGAFTDFTATITATGNVQVTFKSSKGRFFLDEVLVVDPNATGIQEIKVAKPTTEGKIYTLDGRYVGTDFSQLRRGVYIVNGKKVMK